MTKKILVTLIMIITISSCNKHRIINEEDAYKEMGKYVESKLNLERIECDTLYNSKGNICFYLNISPSDFIRLVDAKIGKEMNYSSGWRDDLGVQVADFYFKDTQWKMGLIYVQSEKRLDLAIDPVE